MRWVRGLSEQQVLWQNKMGKKNSLHSPTRRPKHYKDNVGSFRNNSVGNISIHSREMKSSSPKEIFLKEKKQTKKQEKGSEMILNDVHGSRRVSLNGWLSDAKESEEDMVHQGDMIEYLNCNGMDSDSDDSDC